ASFAVLSSVVVVVVVCSNALRCFCSVRSRLNESNLVTVLVDSFSSDSRLLTVSEMVLKTEMFTLSTSALASTVRAKLHRRLNDVDGAALGNLLAKVAQVDAVHPLNDRVVEVDVAGKGQAARDRLRVSAQQEVPLRKGHVVQLFRVNDVYNDRVKGLPAADGEVLRPRLLATVPLDGRVLHQLNIDAGHSLPRDDVQIVHHRQRPRKGGLLKKGVHLAALPHQIVRIDAVNPLGIEVGVNDHVGKLDVTRVVLVSAHLQPVLVNARQVDAAEDAVFDVEVAVHQHVPAKNRLPVALEDNLRSDRLVLHRLAQVVLKDLLQVDVVDSPLHAHLWSVVDQQAAGDLLPGQVVANRPLAQLLKGDVVEDLQANGRHKGHVAVDHQRWLYSRLWARLSVHAGAHLAHLHPVDAPVNVENVAQQTHLPVNRLNAIVLREENVLAQVNAVQDAVQENVAYRNNISKWFNERKSSSPLTFHIDLPQEEHLTVNGILAVESHHRAVHLVQVNAVEDAVVNVHIAQHLHLLHGKVGLHLLAQALDHPVVAHLPVGDALKQPAKGDVLKVDLPREGLRAGDVLQTAAVVVDGVTRQGSQIFAIEVQRTKVLTVADVQPLKRNVRRNVLRGRVPQCAVQQLSHGNGVDGAHLNVAHRQVVNGQLLTSKVLHTAHRPLLQAVHKDNLLGGNVVDGAAHLQRLHRHVAPEDLLLHLLVAVGAKDLVEVRHAEVVHRLHSGGRLQVQLVKDKWAGNGLTGVPRQQVRLQVEAVDATAVERVHEETAKGEVAQLQDCSMPTDWVIKRSSCPPREAVQAVKDQAALKAGKVGHVKAVKVGRLCALSASLRQLLQTEAVEQAANGAVVVGVQAGEDLRAGDILRVSIDAAGHIEPINHEHPVKSLGTFDDRRLIGKNQVLWNVLVVDSLRVEVPINGQRRRALVVAVEKEHVLHQLVHCLAVEAGAAVDRQLVDVDAGGKLHRRDNLHRLALSHRIRKERLQVVAIDVLRLDRIRPNLRSNGHRIGDALRHRRQQDGARRKGAIVHQPLHVNVLIDDQRLVEALPPGDAVPATGRDNVRQVVEAIGRSVHHQRGAGRHVEAGKVQRLEKGAWSIVAQANGVIRQADHRVAVQRPGGQIHRRVVRPVGGIVRAQVVLGNLETAKGQSLSAHHLQLLGVQLEGIAQAGVPCVDDVLLNSIQRALHVVQLLKVGGVHAERLLLRGLVVNVLARLHRHRLIGGQQWNGERAANDNGVVLQVGVREALLHHRLPPGDGHHEVPLRPTPVHRLLPDVPQRVVVGEGEAVGLHDAPLRRPPHEHARRVRRPAAVGVPEAVEEHRTGGANVQPPLHLGGAKAVAVVGEKEDVIRLEDDRHHEEVLVVAVGGHPADVGHRQALRRDQHQKVLRLAVGAVDEVLRVDHLLIDGNRRLLLQLGVLAQAHQTNVLGHRATVHRQRAPVAEQQMRMVANGEGVHQTEVGGHVQIRLVVKVVVLELNHLQLTLLALVQHKAVQAGPEDGKGRLNLIVLVALAHLHAAAVQLGGDAVPDHVRLRLHRLPIEHDHHQLGLNVRVDEGQYLQGVVQLGDGGELGGAKGPAVVQVVDRRSGESSRQTEHVVGIVEVDHLQVDHLMRPGAERLGVGQLRQWPDALQ
ncbi:hypothetical protein TYRP_001348, partial [Tyrophagus putrescentiae]